MAFGKHGRVALSKETQRNENSIISVYTIILPMLQRLGNRFQMWGDALTRLRVEANLPSTEGFALNRLRDKPDRDVLSSAFHAL